MTPQQKTLFYTVHATLMLVFIIEIGALRWAPLDRFPGVRSIWVGMTLFTGFLVGAFSILELRGGLE